MKRTIIIIAIIVIAFLGGGGIVYYYDYQGSHYITTDDAQVSADMVTITPQLTGRIDDWTAKVGDDVTAGQSLGRQETATQMAISGAALQSAAQSSGQQQGQQAAAQQAALQAQKAAQAQLTALEQQLEAKADITAPVSGKIIEVTAVKGGMAATSTPVAVIADTADAYVTAYIKETDIADIKAGQKVDVKLDAYNGKIFTGTVDTVGQAAQSVFSLLPATNSGSSYTKVTQLIPVKITVKDADGYNLMPGLNASVKIYKDVY